MAAPKGQLEKGKGTSSKKFHSQSLTQVRRDERANDTDFETQVAGGAARGSNAPL